MMYMNFIIEHIHHLMNEYKKLIFTYNSDQRVYFNSTKKKYKSNIETSWEKGINEDWNRIIRIHGSV